MIGDEAYRRPRNRNLDTEKQILNDHAFVILHQKFRIFDTSISLKEENAVSVIKCACILHNLIRKLDRNIDQDFANVVGHLDNINLPN